MGQPMPQIISGWRLRRPPRDIPEVASLPGHRQRATRLSQGLMAELIGCSERQIQRLESGTGPVSRDIVAAVARVLALTEAERAALYVWARHTPPLPDPTAPPDLALIQSVAARPDVGLLILDTRLTVLRAYVRPEQFIGPTVRPGDRFADRIPDQDTPRLVRRLQDVLATGEPALSITQRLTGARGAPGSLASLSALRLHTVEGLPVPGDSLLLTLINIDPGRRRTAPDRRARHYLDLVLSAAGRVGTSLDPTTTAQQIADTLLPLAGDGGLAVVFLAEEIFAGEDPPPRTGEALDLRCAARAPHDAPWPAGFVRPGQTVSRLPETASVRLHQSGERNILPDRAVIHAALRGDPGAIRLLVPDTGHRPIALSVTPVVTATAVVGSLQLWRFGDQFSGDDIETAHRIAARSATAVDLARQHTRALLTVQALQRQLEANPRRLADHPRTRDDAATRPSGRHADPVAPARAVRRR